jgi:hypothetical protein
MAVMAAMSLSVLRRISGILGNPRVIIKGFSVCHWPGGQLRVSNAERILQMLEFQVPVPP